jgi:hypothetical protein
MLGDVRYPAPLFGAGFFFDGHGLAVLCTLRNTNHIGIVDMAR